MKNIALAIMSHPDDVEFLCAGTLALLSQMGWEIHIATMTAGDKGSKVLTPAEISQIRRREGRKAATVIGATYHCLEVEDVFILYDKPNILRVTKLVRQVRPNLVLTMSPECYMIDHEITARLVQTACFSAGMVNMIIEGVESFDHVPALYYADALEGKDRYGKEVIPSMIVDISSVIDIKEEMLKCHDSQRAWLQAHHGMDEYIASMRRFGDQRGRQIGVAYGEGFRQHLGHAFPQENLLLKTLGPGLVNSYRI